jgi:outer membrane immunogenic protein
MLNVGGSALAADMPVKAPIYRAPPAAVFSWTGLYVGGNVGYSWGRSSNDWDFYAPHLSVFLDPACRPAGFAFCAAGSDSNKLAGVIGGLQAGYNWQSGQLLVGIETDIQASGRQGDRIFRAEVQRPPTIVEASYTQKLQWLGTARGRIGFAVDRALLYATGGLAYGRVTITGSATATGDELAISPPCDDTLGRCPFASWSIGVTKVGWSLGVGAEGAIGGNWSWKIEYLHVDLGQITTNFATVPGCFGTPSVCTPTRDGSGTIKSRITDEVVRVGVNYKFDWGKAPVAVMAKY